MRYEDLSPAYVDPVWATMGPAGPRGEQGPPGESVVGPQGEPGADGLGLTLKGNWNRVAHYKPGDVVTYAFESYAARSANVGKRPTRGSRVWQLLAARGQRGERGEVVMARGPRGFPGETVVVSNVLEIEFATSVAIGSPIFIQSDGQANLARADDAEAASVVGFRVTGGYVTEGQVSIPNLVPGARYFLAADGGISTEAPTQAGLFVVPVGRALSSTVLDIEIGQSVAL